jgi:Xaa-Pro aminopeptidase
VVVDDEVHALRLKRHPAEVDLHKRAAEISDAMIAAAMEWAVRPGVTPARVMAEVEAEGRRAGADSASLWLATGKTPSTTYFELFELAPAIEQGDRIQLGTNVSFEGHFAQGLRIGVLGEPSRELADAAKMLLDMQDAAFAELVPGRPLHHVVDALERLIDENCPYRRDDDPFRFQSCHGLGLNYNEPGMAAALTPLPHRAKAAEELTVTENMVLEIHPNFTVPGLGHVCAGDVALATVEGAQLLTHYPRGLVVLS